MLYTAFVHELMTKVVGLLTAAGDDTPHLFGRKHLAASGKAPRYVWVPIRGTGVLKKHTLEVENFRELAVYREHFEVHCWGLSAAQAQALGNNVDCAIYRLIAADYVRESSEWNRPGEAYNQLGEELIIEGSMSVPSIDAIIPVDTLEIPEPSTWTAARVEGDLYLAPNTEEDGGVEHIDVDTSP